jgi:hypothetical protein
MTGSLSRSADEGGLSVAGEATKGPEIPTTLRLIPCYAWASHYA